MPIRSVEDIWNAICEEIKKEISEKELLDAIRVRNGNLELSLGKPIEDAGEL